MNHSNFSIFFLPVILSLIFDYLFRILKFFPFYHSQIIIKYSLRVLIKVVSFHFTVVFFHFQKSINFITILLFIISVT